MAIERNSLARFPPIRQTPVTPVSPASPASTSQERPSHPAGSSSGTAPEFVDRIAAELLVRQPVRQIDGSLFITVDGRRFCQLRHLDGSRVAAFADGWTAKTLYIGVPDTLLLDLGHANGAVTTWFLSGKGRLIANQLGHLPPHHRDPLIAHVDTLAAAGAADAGSDYAEINPNLRREIEVYRRRSVPGLGGPDAGRTLPLVQALAGTGAARVTLTRVARWHDGASETGGIGFEAGWTTGPRRRSAGGVSTLRFADVPPSTHYELALQMLPATQGALLRVEVDGRTVARTRIGNLWDKIVRRRFWLPPEAVMRSDVEIRLVIEESALPEAGFELVLAELRIGDIVPREELASADLLARFESIGENCQFGNVQRRAGIEPLGLLRFAGALRLVRMFEDDFAGLGEPGSLRTALAGGHEFQIYADHYGLFYHTFRYETDTNATAMVEENLVKIRYLIRKLREDMEDGEKIFVFRRLFTGDLAEIVDFHAVLRRFGPVKLLWVTEGAPDRAPGDVEWLGVDLLRGYLGPDAADDPATFDFDHWTLLCRHACDAFRRKRWG